MDEASEGHRPERGAGLDDVREGVRVGARRGGVGPHLDVEEDGEAVVPRRGEPADEPVPRQRRRGGGAREHREHRDGVAEPARQHVHAQEPGVERRVVVVDGESARHDGAGVDLEAQREVRRRDAAAQERQQAGRVGDVRDGRRSGESGRAAWPPRQLEDGGSEAHGELATDGDEAVVVEA